jgi:hypothetical protein
LVSLNRLTARLANFVIDAWKAYADRARIGGDDRKSQSMLRRLSGSYNRAEAAVPLAGSSGCCCRGDGCFYPSKDDKPNFAFNMVRRRKPLHQAILKIAKRVVSSICIPIGFCGETNPGGQLQARSISSLHHARSSTPRRPAFSPVGQIRTVTQGVGRQKRYVDNLLEAIVRMMGTSSEVTDPFGNPQKFTIPELAELIIEMTGTNSKIRFESLPLDDPRQRQTS